MSVVLRVGRYEALRPIASGGMATVYLGRAEGARGFERQVAIKAMHPHLAEDPEFVTMFLDEARMAANIRHPNVVPTLDVAEEGGQLFLIMEYVEGLSLHALKRALKKQHGSVPLPIALRVALDMLAGLHAAHELTTADGAPMKLVHRDVSPQNVLVGVDGVSRIMDFGIARAEIRITATQGAQVKGKTAYMAPEQIRAQPIDRRSDVYAAGIVAWELITGERLYRADNEGSLVQMVLEGATRTPSQLNPAVTPEIDAVCMRALTLSPDERWQTAADFAEALEIAAEKSHVTIATQRAVGAFVKALPPAPMRSAESMLTPSVSGARPALPSSSASSISAISSVSQLSQARRDPGTGTDATSALTGEKQASLDALPPARGGGARRAILAAVAASLVTGGAVWALTRGAPTPDEAPATAALPSASALVSAAIVAPSAAPTPTTAPSASASSAPSSRTGPSKSGASTPRVVTPVIKPKTGAFRPEEP
jgi:eukaryotic-like serine/threonine-protein kinase